MTVFRTLAMTCSLLAGWSVQAAELKGVGLFEILDKPWFATALYTQQSRTPGDDEQLRAIPERLEFKVVEDNISQRRFRQLWLDVLASTDYELLADDGDVALFLGAVKGSLKQDDYLVLQQEDGHVSLSINYHEHAQLSTSFLTTLVGVLTARISPIPELKHGLLGKLPEEQQRGIQKTFDQGEPSLHRISQTRRWLRSQAVNQLAANDPSV